MKTLKDKVMEVFPVAPEDEADFEPVMLAAFSGLDNSVVDMRTDVIADAKKEGNGEIPEVLGLTGVSVTYAFAKADAMLPSVLRGFVDSQEQFEKSKDYYERLGKAGREALMKAVMPEVLENSPIKTELLNAPIAAL